MARTVTLLLLLLVAENLTAQPAFMHGIYDMQHVVDLIGCTDNNGVNCYAGSHGDIFVGWSGKVYGCDSAGNTLFESIHSIGQHHCRYIRVCPLTGGGFAVAGYSSHTSSGNINPVVSLLDASGNLISLAQYDNGLNGGFLPHITSDGTGYILAFQASFPGNLSNICLLRANQGGIVRQVHLGTDSLLGPVTESVRAIERSSAGDVYVLGGAGATGIHYYFLHKLDSTLNLTWTAIFPDTSFNVYDMVVQSNGNVFLGGSRRDSSGINEPFLANLDANGNLLWTKSYSSSLINYFSTTLASAPGDGATMVGCEVFNNQGYLTMTRIRVDSLGQVLLGSSLYGFGIEVESWDSHMTSDGNMLVAGRTSMGQGHALKMNSNAPATCYDSVVTVTEVQRVLSISYMNAEIDSANFQANSPTVVASSSLTKTILCFSTDIAERHDEPITYNNPVTDQLHLNNLEGFEQLSVYDISGRCILKEKFPGNSSWNIGTATWPQGLYVVMLQGMKKNLTIRIVKY